VRGYHGPVKLPTVLNEPPKRLRTVYRIGLSAWTDKSLLEEGHFYPYKTMTLRNDCGGTRATSTSSR
jgi:hypothetical protein